MAQLLCLIYLTNSMSFTSTMARKEQEKSLKERLAKKEAMKININNNISHGDHDYSGVDESGPCRPKSRGVDYLIRSPRPTVWDCGSQLYDSYELKMFNRQLSAAMAAMNSRLRAMPTSPCSVIQSPLCIHPGCNSLASLLVLARRKPKSRSSQIHDSQSCGRIKGHIEQKGKEDGIPKKEKKKKTMFAQLVRKFSKSFNTVDDEFSKKNS